MLEIQKDMPMAYPTVFGVQVTNERGQEVWIEISANVEARTFEARVDVNAGFTPKEVEEALEAVREGVINGSIVLPLTVPLWELQTPDDFTSVTEMLTLPVDA